MTPEALHYATGKLLESKLTISKYGYETSFTQEDLKDYVEFDTALGNDLAELEVRFINPLNSDDMVYEMNNFWARAAESFVLTNSEIRDYFAGC
jgi:Uma2 family endonuclease